VTGAKRPNAEAVPMPEVTITFGPCGRISFDPPVTLEVAAAIKREIEEAIEMANRACRHDWGRRDDDDA